MDQEHQILIDCLKHALRGETAGVLPTGTIDYDRLWALAQHHRAIPFLPAFFRYNDWKLPEAFGGRLSEAMHVHVARNTFMTETLLDLLGIFNEKGIRVIPLRGPLMAARLFGDPIYRQCDDLDLLLEPDAVLEAKRILMERGFRPHLEMSPDVENLSIRAGWEIILKSPDDRFSVELHTQLTPKSYGVRIPMSAWWRHVEDWRWDGKTILTFELPWLYLANMIHSAKHLWSRLGWLADLYALERVGDASMVEAAESEANRYGIGRMVKVGRALVTTTMARPRAAKTDREAAIPPEKDVGRDVRLIHHIVSGELPSRIAMLRLQAELRDGWWEGAKYLTAELCEPSYSDWLSCPALHRAPWLFYLWRPFRLLADMAGGRGRRRPLSAGYNQRVVL